MKKTDIITMLKELGLIVVEGTDECEEDMLYITTDNLTCEEVDEVITILTEKSDEHIKGTWSESFIIEQYEIVADYE